jgi:hypothetical protein
MEDCIVYLVFQLRQGGFEVRFTWPNLLFISWRHHEATYLTKQNPIIKAMTPEPPKPIAHPKPVSVPKPKKAAEYQPPASNSNPTVRFQTDVDLLTSITPSYSQFASPPRKAADYQPPDTFLQNLDRPVKESIPTYKGGMGTKTNDSLNTNMNDVLGDLWKV